MRFDQDFVQRVREASNIVEVISQDTPLKGAAGRMMGLCPFPDHKEKSPSFSVSESKQVYHCFGCKKSGDVFTYLEQMRGLSFPEAIEYLANRAGLSVPQDVRMENRNRLKADKGKLLAKLNQEVALFFHENLFRLPKTSPVWSYMKNRGLTPELAKLFMLGYSEDGWESLASYLNEKKIPLNLAQQVGLLRERAAPKSGFYDIFRNRLMFPIVSPSGTHLGFGGRTLGDEQPKYLNSPESEIFHKGQTFYGLSETAKHIRAQDLVVVVEGYMDALALYTSGVLPVVATLGTAFTENHARVLKRFTGNVVLLYDGDEAGRAGATRALPILLSAGVIPKSVFLPDELDPDDFVRKFGSEALQEKISNARDLLTLITDEKFKSQTGLPSEKVKIVDEMAAFYDLIEDRRIRELYIKDLSERMQVTVTWVTQALQEKAKGQPRPVKEIPKAPTASPANSEAVAGVGSLSGANEERPKISITSEPSKAEVYLLNLALMRASYLDQIIESGAIELLTNDGIRKIFDRVSKIYRQMPSEFDNLTALLTHEVDPPHWVSQHLDKSYLDLTEEAGQKMVSDCIVKVRQMHLRSESRKLLHDLRGKSQNEQLEKLEQIMNIQKVKHLLKRDKSP